VAEAGLATSDLQTPPLSSPRPIPEAAFASRCGHRADQVSPTGTLAYRDGRRTTRSG